jgi:coenzyme F420-0:L-glutamate ligase/coenzyme F420-1:gamma-L-glutamate ligase
VIEVFGVTGLPEVRPGDDLAALIAGAVELADGDVVVVAQKVVSKAEGALVEVEPGEDRAAVRRRLARAEAARIVCDAPSTLIVQTRHGLVCANAGIDASNVADGWLALLPRDPDASARLMRARLAELTGACVAVIIADTFGRPWRMGQTDVAIGAAGLSPIRDERGDTDRYGAVLEVTQVAVADELAAAADLVRRKADGVPVVVVRGFTAPAGGVGSTGTGGASLLVRGPEEDLFAHGRGWLADTLAAAEVRAEGSVDARHVQPDDLARVVAAACGAARGLARVVPTAAGGALHVQAVGEGPEALVAAGVAAGALVAALLDLGYDARWEAPFGGGTAGAIVQVGAAGDR